MAKIDSKADRNEDKRNKADDLPPSSSVAIDFEAFLALETK